MFGIVKGHEWALQNKTTLVPNRIVNVWLWRLGLYGEGVYYGHEIMCALFLQMHNIQFCTFLGT